MPDQRYGNVMLAAHSGNARVSYFKNLNKLEMDDNVSISYKGKIYNYKVVNIYDIEKTGKAQIIRNKNVSTLTLVTCRHNTNKQIIVICELVDIK
jgi:LPXTG-site transpeptidase (sortase) family protein